MNNLPSVADAAEIAKQTGFIVYRKWTDKRKAHYRCKWTFKGEHSLHAGMFMQRMNKKYPGCEACYRAPCKENPYAAPGISFKASLTGELRRTT